MAYRVRARRAAGTVRIFDTTLRDGEQAPGAGLTAAEKLEVARQLARLNVDVIEAGFPAASPGDFEAVQRIARETKGVADRRARPLPRRRPAAGRRGDPGRRAAAPPRVHRHERHPPQAQAPDRPRRGPRRGRQVGRATAARRSAATPRSSSPPRTPRAPTSTTCMQVYEAVVEAGASHRQHPGHRRLRDPGRVRRARRAGRRARRPRRDRVASTATTTWAWRPPTRWPPSRPARARSR